MGIVNGLVFALNEMEPNRSLYYGVKGLPLSSDAGFFLKVVHGQPSSPPPQPEVFLQKVGVLQFLLLLNGVRAPPVHRARARSCRGTSRGLGLAQEGQRQASHS